MDHTQNSATMTAEERFDIRTSTIQSFGALNAARSTLFRSRHDVQRFADSIDSLSNEGDEGRRKGLGLWMIGRYADAAAILERHESDNVAAFTLARSCMSLERWDKAAAIFERLSKSYPDEPRPRSGMLEARLEMDLKKGDSDQAAANLETALQATSPAFGESAEGRYLHGRMNETRGDLEAAIDHYAAARALDPQHRANLFRLAYLGERVGLEELALDAYQQLARQLPVDRVALQNLGVLYEDLGRHQEAAACYDTIVRSLPTDVRARLFFEDAKAGISMYYDEDMERKQDRLDQILRIPITDFELSVRARNCLNKMNITTLGDLVKQTEAELLSYKNFGETSLNEIKEILGQKGLRLGMAREEAVASIEANRRRAPVPGDASDVSNKPVSELELSIRARRTVESLGCITVGDVIQHSEDELLGMPNFGQTSLQELKSKLSELGLKLKTKTI